VEEAGGKRKSIAGREGRIGVCCAVVVVVRAVLLVEGWRLVQPRG